MAQLPSTEVALVDSPLTRDGTVDYHGQTANKLRTGGFKITPVILGAEFSERVAGFAIYSNIFSYLFYEKHLDFKYAMNMTTNFIGTSFVLSLLGGYIADTYWGRFHTIFISGFIQCVGYGILIVSASLEKFQCLDPETCSAAEGTNLATIYVGLYVIALGIGGVKSSVSAFGADQFDREDSREAAQLPTYFNWFYFFIMMGALMSVIVVYIQDKNWSWGFGTQLMIVYLFVVIFVALRTFYRYKIPQGSPLSTLGRVFVSAVHRRNLPHPVDNSGFFFETRQQSLEIVQTQNMRWLDKAAILQERDTTHGPQRLASVAEVEDTKLMIRLLPIAATTWFFWTVQAQFATITISQAWTSNRHLGPHFTVPPAVVGVMQTIFVLISVPIYDRVFVPFARRFTGNPTGITNLQRLGLGLVTPILAMTCAALVERRRLGVVHEKNMDLHPRTPIESFSMFWFTPQNFFMGLGEALMYPGQINFFYTEAPKSMQSLGTSMTLSTLGIGYFGSSAIASAVHRATSTSSSSGWFQNNVNESRLDYYYWALAVLAVVNLVAFLMVSRLNMYKRTNSVDTSRSLDEEQQ
ncbi:protein MpNPF12 [Marchantia polymorpha subsp. ruderalis]|uniref:Uncharacterized protein n=2 Tax=Marchantia polymorpha TaxID=3197 RepID=A0AAF6B081_MARPO|nr:hypothetical protein MARPO_0050s0082 [Marchantia polymorpha]BBN05415.1 hypothetical protein Mp_3g12900 [Marchantia polymorpha subsp. ruderalis]|eukprot:PTQ38628.1 hypothetical protein MARPO_0050s0082 [Marchantia polymorpha]